MGAAMAFKDRTAAVRGLQDQLDATKHTILLGTGWTRTIMNVDDNPVCYYKVVGSTKYVAMNADTAIRIETCLQKGGSPLGKQI